MSEGSPFFADGNCRCVAAVVEKCTVGDASWEVVSRKSGIGESGVGWNRGVIG